MRRGQGRRLVDVDIYVSYRREKTRQIPTIDASQEKENRNNLSSSFMHRFIRAYDLICL